MLQIEKNSIRGCSLKRAAATVIFVFIAAGISFPQPVISTFSQPKPAEMPTVKLASAEFISEDGLTIERLIELGANRRADLLAARQRLLIAEGRIQQAKLRPNPSLGAEYGSPRFLGGEAENDVSVGVSQTFELGGKRSKRTMVARLELQQIRAEVLTLERQLAVEIRTAYTNAVAAARRLDVLEKLIAADEELGRIAEARLKEGDAAPLEVNLLRVESERLKVQAIQARSALETQVLQIKTLTGTDIAESLLLAPQSDRPPRLDLGLDQLTGLALSERADLQAARIAEQLGSARINLARANAVPNIEGSVKYSRSTGIIDLPGTLGGGALADRDNEITFGISIDIPIFSRNQGEIAAANGERVQATRRREFLEATIRRDVAVAYRKYRAAAETIVLYSTQLLPRAEENLRAVRAAYGFGEFSIFEIVNEQRRMTENINGYNQSLHDYYAALAELEAALGTAIPANALSSLKDSILPGKDLVPNQIGRESFLKGPEKPQSPARRVLSENNIQKEQEK